MATEFFFSFPSSNCYSYFYEFFRRLFLSPMRFSIHSTHHSLIPRKFITMNHEKSVNISLHRSSQTFWHPSISNMMAFSHYCVQRIGLEARWTMDKYDFFFVDWRIKRKSGERHKIMNRRSEEKAMKVNECMGPISCQHWKDWIKKKKKKNGIRTDPKRN